MTLPVAGQGIALGSFPLLDELVSPGRVMCLHPGAMESPDRYYMTISTCSQNKLGASLFWNLIGQHRLPPFNTLMADALN